MNNATLLDMREPGRVDRHGDVTANGATVWSGRHPVYMHRARKRLPGKDSTVIEFDQIIFTPRADIPTPVPGDGATGYTVLVETGSGQMRYRITGVEPYEVGSGADSVRLNLADERTE